MANGRVVDRRLWPSSARIVTRGDNFLQRLHGPRQHLEVGTGASWGTRRRPGHRLLGRRDMRRLRRRRRMAGAHCKSDENSKRARGFHGLITTVPREPNWRNNLTKAAHSRYYRVVLRKLLPIACAAVLAVSCRSRGRTSKKAVAVGSAKPVAAQESPAKRFAAWLTAFNAADRQALLDWRAKNLFDPPIAFERELAFWQLRGGFDVKKTEESSATRFAVLLKEKESDQFVRATLVVAAAEPYKVTDFSLRAIPTPDEFRPKRMSEADAISALRAEIEEVVAHDRFAGAVLVAKHGTPIFAQAYGLADRAKKIPNKLDTKFRIGSMNKMFTATAVLQLVQSGKLALTDSLGKIVHGYPNQAVAMKVTIDHLLTHTGGTGDIFGPEFDAHRLELRTLDDYVKLYGKRDLAFEPGSKWAYSNYGFLLLGVVIEHATGTNYYDWVDEHVFRPAGMTGTGSLPEDQAVPDRAVGYMKHDPMKPWQPNTDTLPYRGTSAGGGYSTVTDLLRFANAITGHRLLDAKYADLLTTGKVKMPLGGMYAYGFVVDSSDGVRCVGHSGGAPGMNGDLEICDSGYTIIVLSNLDPPVASRISAFIQNRLPAHAP